MKSALVVLLLAAASFSQDAKETGYPVTVHVSKSQLFLESTVRYQRLDVLIDQKHHVLESIGPYGTLLATGDYKAKLVTDQHSRAYESKQVYQFLFDDGKKREYLVVEQDQ